MESRKFYTNEIAQAQKELDDLQDKINDLEGKRADLRSIIHCHEESLKALPPEDQELVDGERYWLGATWGVYDEDSDTFNLGNCFVYRANTWFSKTAVAR